MGILDNKGLIKLMMNNLHGVQFVRGCSGVSLSSSRSLLMMGYRSGCSSSNILQSIGIHSSSNSSSSSHHRCISTSTTSKNSLNTNDNDTLPPPPHHNKQEMISTKLYPSHIPSSTLEKGYLAVTSAFAALRDPTQAERVAMLGETTGHFFLTSIRNKMLLDKTGRRILRERPLLDIQTISLEKLNTLPIGSFGKEYAQFMLSNGISPQGRSPVHYVDDAELAYVMTRYRQIHDFWHTLTGLDDISVETELALKWFEWVQTGLPMTMLSSLVGPLRLTSLERKRLFNIYVPWALRTAGNAKFLMNVMYEELWERDLVELRRELGITSLPPSSSSSS